MMRGGSTSTKVLMATTALALLLAGCTSGDPAPVPVAPVATTTSAEPLPTPTSSPTAPAPTKPVPPADLSRTDEVGAAAAATYFLELYGYTLQTGDVAAWESMSWESCSFCHTTRELALSLVSGDETYEGGDLVPGKTTVYPIDDLVGGYPVDVEFSQSRGIRTNAAGTIVNDSPADSGTFGVDVVHLAGVWRVLAVTAQDA